MATAVAYAAERPPDVWVGKPSRDLALLLVRVVSGECSTRMVSVAELQPGATVGWVLLASKNSPPLL